VISSLWSWLSHTASPQSALWSTVLTGFLVWRVSRGGRISRMILIIISGVSHVVVALDVARLWDRAVMAAAIICAAQIALLVSPPVYGRTGPTAQRLRAVGPGASTSVLYLAWLWMTAPTGASDYVTESNSSSLSPDAQNLIG